MLIYCPQKRSVNSFAKAIIDLHLRGALKSVLEVPHERIGIARALGSEWLGPEHPIMQCLDIGVAIHHGTLPHAFRREMERLLREGILKVTVSSPTLAQGLNLGATTVIVYSLYRSGNLIAASEFRNVVGRAGRAFVDVHGLVLNPVFDKPNRRKREWRRLVEDTSAGNLVSGLLQLVLSLLARMAGGLNTNKIDEITEYILNSSCVWACPAIPAETAEQSENGQKSWSQNIQMLDTALLSLLGSDDILRENVPEMLDEILQSSLWRRCLDRRPENQHEMFVSILHERANFIWDSTTTQQRRGYFLAGIGLETGLQMDEIKDAVSNLLLSANKHIARKENELAIQEIIQLAELVFDIQLFTPNKLPDSWKDIIKAWLNGKALVESSFGDVDAALEFIEDGLVYRLIWGLEAIRVSIDASEETEISDIFSSFIEFNDQGPDLVISALEFGTLDRSTSLLMQYGFSSRKAALIAVESSKADFSNRSQCIEWLNSETISEFSIQTDWPTIETSSMWHDFVKEFQSTSITAWGVITRHLPVTWTQGFEPVPGMQVKITNFKDGVTEARGGNGENLGLLSARYKLLNTGIYNAVIADNTDLLVVEFCGSDTNPFEEFKI